MNYYSPIKETLLNSLLPAVQEGLNYLYHNQLKTGEFRSYRARDPHFVLDREFDSSPFPTALITYCLTFFDTHESNSMQDKACEFFLDEMEASGLWRYWTSKHPYHKHIPFDLDDICCVSSVLRLCGLNFPTNRSLIVGNRNHAGLFYTWIAPRFDIPRTMKNLFETIHSALNPLSLYYFWKLNESSPDDIDSVVNANVVYYLGECTESRQAIAYLNKLIFDEKEKHSDKWHLSVLNLYYFLSRNYYKGMTCFESVKEIIIQRIFSCNKDPLLGEHLLDTALALCTLMNFGCFSEKLLPSIELIISSQNKDGSWSAFPLYWGGPKKYYCWGSEELTTAFCLEALERFRQFSRL